MLRIGSAQPPPQAPDQAQAGAPPPELLQALMAQQGAPEAPPDQATEQPAGREPKYDLDKVSQEVARYMAPGAKCGGCEFYIPDGQCHIVSGNIDPEGICSLFTPKGSESQDEDIAQDGDNAVNEETQDDSSPEQDM